MDDSLWIHVNDRGVTRQVEELWIPSLRADVVWLSHLEDSNVVSAYTERLVPVVEASPVELAALDAEQQSEGRRALAIFRSLTAVMEAAEFGLDPQVVNLVSLQSDPGTRIAPGVWLNRNDIVIARQLLELGFELVVQSLPNVTCRPLDREVFQYPQPPSISA